MTFLRKPRRLALSGVAAALWPLSAVAQQSEALPEIAVTADRGTSAAKPVDNPTINPVGQTQSTIQGDRTTNTRAFTVNDLLIDSPGVQLKQGNGPRDIGISIRGSNARNGFGVRNIRVFEDGFPVTQPDGLSRTDLVDPHAYSGIDVVRGPSSALYGNYATGGAVNFRTRTGGEIDGIEIGTDVGSYGFLNNYIAVGRKLAEVEASVFASNVRGDGATSHSMFSTQTVNALLTYKPTPDDRLTFKFIENHLYGDLSVRLSLNQFGTNPYQRGCATFAAAAAGCGSVTVFNNGYAGASSSLSADQAGLHRNDNRAIVGVRWEHDFDNATTWRNQVVIDDRNINQPTGATTAQGDYPSINVISDVTNRGKLFGLDATHYAAFFFNRLAWTGNTFNIMPGGNAALGGLTNVVRGAHTNVGGRAREEIRLTDRVTLVGGIGVESTTLRGSSTSYAYAAPVIPASTTIIGADRAFLNVAPEIALLFRPDSAWQARARVATGYGTPQVGNLFVTSAGLNGSNTQLAAQRNLGYDLGVDWTPLENVKLSVTGFYEFFRNELVTQSPGPAPLQPYTFNAPRSEHRGVEVAADWRFAPGWKFTAAYSYDNQIYTQYAEQLSAGAFTNVFNRAGNRIPGVSPNLLLARLGYDETSGPLKGFGAYAEYVLQSAFFIDNADLVQVPGYGLVNVNVHYSRDISDSFIKTVAGYFEVRNLANKTYVASANNLSNSISAANGSQNPASVVAAATGSIYAGTPRTFVGGVKIKF